mmetsp:Transcript_49093/g.132225  ORF Transcript_49093/g.132225 Transcript_49093/m.132225 type:complete len:260 (-) Transcript_49093:96-875(-)
MRLRRRRPQEAQGREQGGLRHVQQPQGRTHRLDPGLSRRRCGGGEPGPQGGRRGARGDPGERDQRRRRHCHQRRGAGAGASVDDASHDVSVDDAGVVHAVGRLRVDPGGQLQGRERVRLRLPQGQPPGALHTVRPQHGALRAEEPLRDAPAAVDARPCARGRRGDAGGAVCRRRGGGPGGCRRGSSPKPPGRAGLAAAGRRGGHDRRVRGSKMKEPKQGAAGMRPDAARRGSLGSLSSAVGASLWPQTVSTSPRRGLDS